MLRLCVRGGCSCDHSGLDEPEMEEAGATPSEVAKYVQGSTRMRFMLQINGHMSHENIFFSVQTNILLFAQRYKRKKNIYKSI